MKRYYSITILAIIVITLLQGYNISLQYKDYLHYKIEKINSVFKVAIDEEYAIRAHKNYNPHKDGKQRLYTKLMTDEDFIKAKPKKEDIIDFDEINIQDLRDKGIAETEAEAMGLLTKDILTTKGNPINLKKLSQIFKKNLNEDFSYTLLILDENKMVIKSYGQTKDIESWQASKPIGIGLKPIRFIQAKVDITPSSFIRNSIETLVATILLALIIVFCVGYQMIAIRNKEDLLRNREVSIHGTIHDLKAPLASVLLTLGFIKDSIEDIQLQELLTFFGEEDSESCQYHQDDSHYCQSRRKQTHSKQRAGKSHGIGKAGTGTGRQQLCRQATQHTHPRLQNRQGRDSGRPLSDSECSGQPD